MNKIKFLVFADLHHYPGIFYTEAVRRLEKIKERAVNEKVDMVLHLGDMCHGPHLEKEFVEKYNSFPVPVYHTIGNHENDNSGYEEILEAYNMENGYYYFDMNGFKFVIMDLNYMVIGDKVKHYDHGDYLGNYKEKGKVSAYVGMGDEQMKWLEETIMISEYPCILCSHQSIERIDSGFSFSEMEKIWDMIERVNKDKQRILLVMNGHHHRDNLRIFKNIAFFDVNSASMDWLETPHDKFPEELMEEYSLCKHSVVWNEPLTAVVTLTDDGEIKIEGSESDWFMGYNRENLGYKIADKDGRLCTARIESADIKINLKNR